MSTKVASLFAEITADTSGFQKASRGVKKELTEQERALQAFSRQATLEAKSFAAVERQKQQALARTAREAEKAARDSARAQQQAHADLKNTVMGTIGVFTLLAGVAIKAYDSFQKQAGAVRDLALITGTGAEETSRFLQVIDDYQLTAEDATAATKALKEKGLVPTIDTLATLADRYKQIKDPAERMQFVQDNLGKGGAKWVNILSQESSELRKQAEQVNKNLILTDAQIRQAEKQRLAVDAATDAWQGLTMQLGAAAGEKILEIQSSTNATQKMWEYIAAHNNGIVTIFDVIEAKKAVAEEARREAAATAQAASQTMNHSHVLREYGETIRGEVIPAMEEAHSHYSGLISTTERIASETQNYNQKQQDLIGKQNTIKKQLDDLAKKGFDPLSKEVQDLKKEYNALGKQSTDLANEHSRAMKKMQYDLIATKLATDGLTEEEYNLQIQVGETLGVFDSASANAARAMNQVSAAILAGKIKANQLDYALRLMEQHQYNINVVMDILAQYTNGPGGGGLDPSGNGGNPVPVNSGGQLPRSGWALVGDAPGGALTPWSELISPSGYVFDAKTTRKLMASGMIGQPESHAMASESDGGVSRGATIMSNPTPTRPWRATRPEREETRTVEGVDVMEMAAEVSRVQVDMQKEIQRAVTASMNAFNDRVDELISVMAVENPRAIAKGVSFELKRITG